MNSLNAWQITLLVLFPLFMMYSFLGSGDQFLLGAIICACLITGCFCSFVLNKPEINVLFFLIALAFTDRQAPFLSYTFYLINFVIAITFIHYLSNNFTDRKYFWFFPFWVCSYHALILIIHPYSVPVAWLIYYATDLAIFLLCVLIKWDAKKIMYIVIPHLIYLMCYGFLEKLVLNPIRVGGPTTHATNYAIILTFLWTIWFVWAYLRKIPISLLTFVTFLVIFLVFLSGTRMGLIGIMIGLFGAVGTKIWINNLHKSLAKKITYALSIFFTIIILIAVAWQLLPQNIFLIKAWNVLLTGNLDPSSIGRLLGWASAIESFTKHPILGIGPGNFDIAFTEFISKHLPFYDTHSMPMLKHAHSTGFNVLAEYGLSGVIMLLTVIVICWLQLINFIWDNPQNPLGYSLFFGGIVIFCLPMIDMIPSQGLDCWFYGILASLGFHKNILSNPKNELNIKSVS
ncbi:MAG: O-antigen ligase family protein [Fibromonadaceae bacterium]|nr:O-antigen ligase family protein [Fibromonadaceae bacterium]